MKADKFSLNGELVRNLMYDIYSTVFIYILGIYYSLKQLLFSSKLKSSNGFKMRTGQVAIVTGGLQGIGLEVVRQLMTHGMHVVIASPKSSKFKDIIQDLEKSSEGIVEFMEMDLRSLRSINKFADEFLNRKLPLNILVNNAGIMFGPYTLTENEFESQLGINYLGHLYLTYKLMPRLRETGKDFQKSRIINVSSCCHYAGRININDLNSKKYYSPYGCYSQSKLAIVMISIIISELFEKNHIPITVNSVHPGVINTDLYRNTFFYSFPFFTRILLKSPQEGAKNVVYIALADEIEGIGGKYFEDCEIKNPNKLSQDKWMQKELWKHSCKLLGINDFLN